MPDRTWNPHAYEVRKVHQEVGFRLSKDFRKLFLRNKYFFRDLSNYNFIIELLKNGNPIITAGKVAIIIFIHKNHVAFFLDGVFDISNGFNVLKYFKTTAIIAPN